MHILCNFFTLRLLSLKRNIALKEQISKSILRIEKVSTIFALSPYISIRYSYYSYSHNINVNHMRSISYSAPLSLIVAIYIHLFTLFVVFCNTCKNGIT